MRVGVVTGRVSDDDREELRERFRLNRDDDTAIDVLLSSDIGYCRLVTWEASASGVPPFRGLAPVALPPSQKRVPPC